MDKAIIFLMIVGIGVSAYARARREGTWSWLLFGKTMLALLILCGAIGVFGVWLGGQLGPEHALLATILVVAVIAAGVVIITLWLQSKTKSTKH